MKSDRLSIYLLAHMGSKLITIKGDYLSGWQYGLQFQHEGIGDGGFSTPRVTCEEYGKTPGT